MSKGGKTGEGTGPVEERGLVRSKGGTFKGKKKVKRNKRKTEEKL